jgi:O-antigen ligase
MTATTLQIPGFQAQQRATSAVERPGADSSPFQRLGYAVLLVFLFLIFSRIFDVKFSYLHLTGVSARVAFTMTILSLGFVTALRSNIGKALLGFTFWFGLSVPFSLWGRGSLELFRDQWLLFSFAAFLATAGLIGNYDQCRKAIHAVAWGLFAFTVIANLFGNMDTGRLFLTQGKFANPNEMAQALLIGMPLWGSMMVNTTSFPKKVGCLLVIALMLITTFRTGSRGAMVAFAVMLAVMFLRASIMGKMQLLLGSILVMGLLFATMPGKLISRYKTVAEDQSDDDEMDYTMKASAAASTQSRKVLLRKSLKFTLQHPLFGVGPGMFVVADDADSKASGLRKGVWLGTHNSYTQVSSELGIPALIFYVAAIFFALRDTYRVHKQCGGEPRLNVMANTATGLHYALIVFAVTILFEHIAYTAMLPVFGAFAAALLRTARVEIDRVKSTPAPVAGPALMFRPYTVQQAAQAGRVVA